MGIAGKGPPQALPEPGTLLDTLSHEQTAGRGDDSPVALRIAGPGHHASTADERVELRLQVLRPQHGQFPAHLQEMTPLPVQRLRHGRLDTARMRTSTALVSRAAS